MTLASGAAPAAGAVGGSRLGKVFVYALLAVFAVLFLLPLFVMLVTSFKTLDEIRDGNMLALPTQPTIEPWIKAWSETCVGLTCAGIKGYFWNSIKMVVPAVAISTALGALNGYVLT
jgi:glucose/mannose transport system permease protein